MVLTVLAMTMSESAWAIDAETSTIDDNELRGARRALAVPTAFVCVVAFIALATASGVGLTMLRGRLSRTHGRDQV
jgi:hypothetical protein